MSRHRESGAWQFPDREITQWSRSHSDARRWQQRWELIHAINWMQRGIKPSGLDRLGREIYKEVQDINLPNVFTDHFKGTFPTVF